MQQPARRLAIGVAASAAVHTAIALGLVPAPRSAPHLEAQVLTIELRPAAPAAAAAPVAHHAPAEHSVPAAAPPASNFLPARRASAPSAPAPAPERLELAFDRYYKASELDVRALPINEVQLVYPKTAYEMRLKGRVVVSIFINEHGAIDALSVAEADPPGIFEEHALAAIRALSFTPAMKNGHAVKSQKRIEVTFSPYDSINVP